VTGRDGEAWRAISDELEQWRSQGRRAQFWWRDDDAIAKTAELSRLITLTRSAEIPLALAVIPGCLDDSLAPMLAGERRITVVPHGWRHENYAGETEKKAEFGDHRPVCELLAEVALGLAQVEESFGEQASAIFVPPWNRLDERLVGLLPRARIVAFSRYGPRQCKTPAPGIVEINCHVDPVHWRGGGGFLGLDGILQPLLSLLRNQRLSNAVACEPIGLLTHHLVMDDETWSFVTDLIDILQLSEAADWRSVDEIIRV
jgi:hypothetical protein